ncbi:MAG: transcriptional repressor [Leptospiraceae bacterium]|nr:transcriptional repressor [Leptospiraceae bacterium]MCP5510656.1 transcriptional repressor [Leptospiraceae bacterium]
MEKDNLLNRNFLKKNKLKITKNRLAVLDILQQSEKPLNHSEIMEKLDSNQNWDRVTIYRTLGEFEEKKLIKSLLSSERITYFELVDTLNEHAHIYCENCGKLECLREDMFSFSLKNPELFSISTVEILVKGTCKDCH